MSDRHLWARDYTAIMRHKGKMFTVNDLSLAWMGGVSFPAAGMAAGCVIPAWLITQVVFGWIFGVPWWGIFLTMAVIFAGLYAFLQRDLGDKDTPWRRVALWYSLRSHQPEHIASTQADTTIDTMRWCVIVMRPNKSPHIKAGRALGNREQYCPRPRASEEFEVADDFALFDRWHDAVIAAAQRSPFTTANSEGHSS